MNNIDNEIFKNSMQITYFATAYNDYKIQTEEKFKQLIQHYDAQIGLYQKKIKELESDK